MKRIIFFVIMLIVACLQIPANACTSAIITGKATPDGRPLMWKHRDTGTENNRMVFGVGKYYSYIGLVNSDDADNSEIWSGTNSAGFCIMNTASYNMRAKGDTTKIEDREGDVMRAALSCCATVQDFEHFLDTVSKPLGIEANFGVIDAHGGAAYFESNNFSYKKYDANDEKIAPNGYIIRTNFSCSGGEDKGMGYIRCQTAEELFSSVKGQNFTPEWILASASRSYYHSLLNEDLKITKPAYAIDQDYIPRAISSAAIVFQGVRNGENPQRTTMWTVLGFPPCSVVVPLWVAGGKNLPAIMMKFDTSENAPLCDKVVALKHKVFDIKRGNGGKYMNFALLYNNNGDGIIQKLAPVETEIFKETREKMNDWDANKWNVDEIQKYYNHLNDKIVKAYKNLFDL